MKTYFIDVLTHHYADFSGRASRMQFWMFQLWSALCFAMFWILLLVGIILQTNSVVWLSLVGLLLFLVGTFIPNIAIYVRRLHDINFSGWWLLIWFMGGIGQLVIFIFCCLPSDDENNHF